MRQIAGIYVLGIVISIISMFVMYYAVSDLCGFYANNLRSIFFSGFLTLSGFMLSMMAFIIIKIKEGVFDNEKYLDRVRKGKETNPNLSIYGPLLRLSYLLFSAVFFSLLTAIMQVSLGFWGKIWVVWINVGLAWFSLFLILYALITIISVLKDWFAFIEDEGNKKICNGRPEEPQATH